jgi:hypothetical protein
MKTFQKDDKIPGCNFSYVYEGSLVALQMFENHRRLKVFVNKGVACVTPNCNHVGTRLIFSRDAQGGEHWDVYTDDAILINIDHIVAKANGGNNELANLQPMCSICNTIKRNQDITLDELALLVVEHKKNKEARKIAKRQAKEERRAERRQQSEIPETV